ncbi:MAG: hypothetical protein AAGB93_17720 [Planctomycetota bacterium]
MRLDPTGRTTMNQPSTVDTSPGRSRTPLVLLAILAAVWLALATWNRPKGESWPGILLDQARAYDVDVESASLSKLEYRWSFPVAVVLRGYFLTEAGSPFHVEARRDAPFLGWRTQHFARGSAATEAWGE